MLLRGVPWCRLRSGEWRRPSDAALGQRGPVREGPLLHSLGERARVLAVLEEVMQRDRQDRSHHDSWKRHRVRPCRQPAELHCRRARWQPMVHRLRWKHPRPHYNECGGHQISNPDAQHRSFGHRGRVRRQHLVHRNGHQQHRPNRALTGNPKIPVSVFPSCSAGLPANGRGFPGVGLPVGFLNGPMFAQARREVHGAKAH